MVVLTGWSGCATWWCARGSGVRMGVLGKRDIVEVVLIGESNFESADVVVG